MYVANIVTKNNLNIDKYFNVVESLDEITQGLPTLIIGWDMVKTINPNVDFIDKKLSDDVFWTFKKTERRDIFEEDLYNFIHYSYNLLIKNVNYKFIDLILLSELELKNTFKILKKSTKLIGYKYNNMLYLYTDNTIYGFDLKLLTYLDLDVDKTFEKIKSYCLVFLDHNDILIEYKDIIEMLNNEVKYIPYLYSIEHYE
jgi:hypothetical protein